MMKQLLVTAITAGLLIGGSIGPGLAQEKRKDGASGRKTSAPATAMRARQKQCGTEWKAAKKAGTVEAGMKWPKYWSACNKRLKGAG
jgi:hypothetical protein